MKAMKPLPDRIDAALFDLDGTLVETNIDFPLMRRRMLALAAEQDIDTQSLAELDILAIVELAADRLLSRGMHDRAANLRARAMDILEEIELRHASETQEIPFARELVAELTRQGVRVGIVTRNCRRASEISLGIARIAPDVLICREDSERHKPHPEPLRIALEALGARPEHSVMVGDHLMDIQSGKAAGMITIGFLRDSRPPGFFDQVQPHLVVRDLKEVLRAIVHCDC